MRELSFQETNNVSAALGVSIDADASFDLSSGPSTGLYQFAAGSTLAYYQTAALSGAIAGAKWVGTYLTGVANPLAAVALFSAGYVATPWILNGLDALAPSSN